MESEIPNFLCVLLLPKHFKYHSWYFTYCSVGNSLGLDHLSVHCHIALLQNARFSLKNSDEKMEIDTSAKQEWNFKRQREGNSIA